MVSLAAYDSIVFDLDGTLVDLPVPIERVRAQLRDWFHRRGFDSPMRPILAEIDRGAAALGTTDSDVAEIRAQARAFISSAEVDAAAAAVARPGAAALWRALTARGAKLAIVTNNCAACVVPAMTTVGIGPAPLVVVGRDDVEHAKPDPTGLLRALRRLDASRSAFIGDRDSDVEAAQGAAWTGVAVDAVLVGSGSCAAAVAVVASLAELTAQ